jgi:hypothetical protein
MVPPPPGLTIKLKGYYLFEKQYSSVPPFHYSGMVLSSAILLGFADNTKMAGK